MDSYLLNPAFYDIGQLWMFNALLRFQIRLKACSEWIPYSPDWFFSSADVSASDSSLQVCSTILVDLILGNCTLTRFSSKKSRNRKAFKQDKLRDKRRKPPTAFASLSSGVTSWPSPFCSPPIGLTTPKDLEIQCWHFPAPRLLEIGNMLW